MSYSCPDNTDDVIDSRNVIERIEELEGVRDDCLDASNDIVEDCGDPDCPRHDEDAEKELASLKKLAEQGETIYGWDDGVTLVRDSYWVDYVKEFIEDCGYKIPDSDEWPYNHLVMDYEGAANDLQVDYTNIEFDGITYWAR